MKIDVKKGQGGGTYVNAMIEIGLDAVLTANGHDPMSVCVVETKSGPSEDKLKRGVVIGICLSDCDDRHRELVEKFLSDLEAIDQQQP